VCVCVCVRVCVRLRAETLCMASHVSVVARTNTVVTHPKIVSKRRDGKRDADGAVVGALVVWQLECVVRTDVCAIVEGIRCHKVVEAKALVFLPPSRAHAPVRKRTLCVAVLPAERVDKSGCKKLAKRSALLRGAPSRLLHMRRLQGCDCVREREREKERRRGGDCARARGDSR
jgi:hypothetical protein